MSDIYTAEKDGRNITELRIDGGENVAYRCTAFNPKEGWADLLEVDGKGNFYLSDDGKSPAQKRYYGTITFTDTRENANPQGIENE